MKGTIRGTNLYDVYTGENQKEIRFDNGDVYRIKGTNLHDVYTGRNQLEIEKVNTNESLESMLNDMLSELIGSIGAAALLAGILALMCWIA